MSMIGIHLNNIVGQGWSGSAILMLKSIVDPSVATLAISFFQVLLCMTQVCSSLTVALFIDMFGLDSLKTPHGFGLLMTGQTVGPIVICVPFFYAAGLIVVNKKTAEKMLKQTEEDRVLESYEASAFIWTNAGSEATASLFNEPGKITDLKRFKKEVKYRLS